MSEQRAHCFFGRSPRDLRAIERIIPPCPLLVGAVPAVRLFPSLSKDKPRVDALGAAPIIGAPAGLRATGPTFWAKYPASCAARRLIVRGRVARHLIKKQARLCCLIGVALYDPSEC